MTKMPLGRNADWQLEHRGHTILEVSLAGTTIAIKTISVVDEFAISRFMVPLDAQLCAKAASISSDNPHAVRRNQM